MVIRSTHKFIYNTKEIIFIRITPNDLRTTINEILTDLANLSWLAKISSDPVRKSFEYNAKRTIESLANRFSDGSDDSNMKRKAGEYIVSVLAKSAIIQEEKHNDIPLMELLGRKVTGNPGFDFYTEKTDLVCMLYCGEAKYENNRNAYTTSLSQIEVFLIDNKHISDLYIFERFTTEKSMENLSKGIFGISVAFSTMATSEDIDLLERIKSNTHFKELSKLANGVILVGVDL